MPKILTVDNLMRNKILVSFCCLHKCSYQLVEHLLSALTSVGDSWSFIFSVFGIHLDDAKKAIEVYFSWKGCLVCIK